MCDSLPGAPAGHTPAPRLTSPLLPTGGPKARGGGRGGGAARPAPPASRDAGGAQRGPQGTGRPAPSPGPPFDRVCGPRGKCARGRRPGRHPPSRRGAAARPAPRPPGSPAFLAGACGFLPAPGARSWLAARRGAGLAGHEWRGLGDGRRGDSPGFTRGWSRAASSRLRSAAADTHLGHRSPRPAPPAPPRVRAPRFAPPPGPGDGSPATRGERGCRGLKSEKGLAQGHAG